MSAGGHKVFGIGFQKTGTSSLDAAFRILGYDTDRGVFINVADKTQSLWIEPPLTTANVLAAVLPIAERRDAFSDNPWPLLFRELDARFPGSKFVLTVREPQAWTGSMVRHFDDRSSDVLQWIYGVPCVAGNEACCVKVYEAHNAEVRAHFASRPDDLLEIDVLSSPDWAPLCAFLGKPIPDAPFPHENAAERREQMRRAWWTRTKRRLWDSTPLPAVTILQIRAASPGGECAFSRLLWRKLLRVAASVPFARDVAAMYYCALDPETPLQAKVVVAAALGYFAMPFDLIPDFIVGVGFLDDAAILALGMWFISRYIGQQHRDRAAASLGAFA
jgi:uncharacterized membrane protein YkvA (DUF1232 family)